MSTTVRPRVVALRNLLIFIAGIWYFDFYLNYTLPSEDNLLLFFVAIPIIWASLTQLWTSYSYHEVRNYWIDIVSHTASVLILLSSVFIISTIMNTIDQILDPLGSILFTGMGWIVIVGLGVYDVVDASR